MFSTKPGSYPASRSLIGLLAALGSLSALTDAHAFSSLLSNWQAMYPNSSSETNLSDSCNLCHASSNRSQFNAYGWALIQNGRDFAAVESLNSDGDSTNATNLEEINANTQPGWTTGANNVINGGGVTSSALPPTGTSGALDPAGNNQAPIANASGPYSGTQGISLAFDGSLSTDSDGTIVEYAWDFGDGSIGSGATTSHTYQNTGTFDVTLTVTDDAGDSASATTSATIGAGNLSPTADPRGPYTGTVDTILTFDGSSSTDSDGTIASYAWDFGDGTSGSGETTTHTYTSQGTYNLNLTVTDNDGAVDSASTSVTIDPVNQAPTANAGGPYSGLSGDTIVFDGTGSSDFDGTIASYDWDFGDGSTGTGATPNHAYSATGSYNVSLTVTDDGGLTQTDTTSVSIGEVVNQPPVADANGPYSGTVDAPVTFDGSGSTDPDGTIVTYEWDFGDGATGTGANPIHSYDAEGSYNVTLNVTDNDGTMDSDSSSVTIGTGNLTPTADAGGPYSGTIDTPIQFDASGSSDPDGTIVEYLWDLGDGTIETTPNPSHTYTTSGTYNLTLTVYDENGAMDADTSSVEIASVATGADVYLSELWVPDSLHARVGRRIEQTMTALGQATEVLQGATVTLSVAVPSSEIEVVIPDDSVTQRIRPGNRSRQFEFEADIRCHAEGEYTLQWSATISADQNSDTDNDTLAGETNITCRQGDHHHSRKDD